MFKDNGCGVADVKSDLLTISEVAKEFNITLRALRFYEAKKLLFPLRNGVVRYYNQEQCWRIKMILAGKDLGFSLAEIKELLLSFSALEDKEVAFEDILTGEQIVKQLHYLENKQLILAGSIKKLRDICKNSSYESSKKITA